MALAHDVIPELEISGLPIIPRDERVEIVRSEHGFTPTNLQELQEAFSLKAFPVRRGGAANHLNEVLRHQQKARAKHEAAAAELADLIGMETEPLIDIDPEAAVRSITKSYIGFYRDAQRGFNAIADANEQLQEVDNPNLLLTDVLHSRTGLGYLARYLVLNKISASPSSNISVIDPYTVEYFGSVFRQPDEVVGVLLDKVAVRQGRKLLPDAAKEQLNRFNFWEGHLEQVKRHHVVRGMATHALSLYSGADA